MDSTDNSTGYSIRTAASRTGLSEHVLRVWERRHNAVCPRRDDNGRRIYSDADLQRLLMLSWLVEKGQPIGRIANLDEHELQRQLSVLEAGDQKEATQIAVPAHQQIQDALLKSVLESAKRYDIEACCTALAAAVIGMNIDDLMTSVCSPIMQAIGDEWQAGRLNEAQEHIIGIAFTSFFLPRITSSLNRQRAPAVVFATFSDEQHQMGLLFLASMAATRNIRCFYLGPNLPEQSIAQAANQVNASVICISVVKKVSPKRLADRIQNLRKMIDSETEIWLGGFGLNDVDVSGLPPGCIVHRHDSMIAALDRLARLYTAA